jgi:hypothetical protein
MAVIDPTKFAVAYRDLSSPTGFTDGELPETDTPEPQPVNNDAHWRILRSPLMTTPTHWCPVLGFEYQDGHESILVFSTPTQVTICVGNDGIDLTRPLTLKLRDHLTELLKHMPEDDA